MPVEPIEIHIVKKLVRAGLRRYWTVSIFSRNEWVIEKSRKEREIFRKMFTADVEKVRFRTMIGKFVGDVMLLYGLGDGVITDWSHRHDINAVVEEANKPDEP